MSTSGYERIRSNCIRMRRHLSASKLDRPAAPLTSFADLYIWKASVHSYAYSLIDNSGTHKKRFSNFSSLSGCFSLSNRKDWSSNCKIPLLRTFDKSFRATFILPLIIKPLNFLSICSMLSAHLFWLNLDWIKRASLTSSSQLTLVHKLSLLLKFST